MTSLSKTSSGNITTPDSPESLDVDSDFVVILAALLCALICVVGLIAVARCAWLRRTTRLTSDPKNPANKGLKKSVLRALPKLIFSSGGASIGSVKIGDCPICLSEFVEGDEIRVLPQCGHGFHVGCIDTWLGSHSSCPSCRQILVVARCQKCGGFEQDNNSTANSSSDLEAGLKAREDDPNRFLP
ncbi:RING-H2 finger protein atl80 [Ranunculus cassubicifolius]